DNPFDPTRGMRFNLTASYSGGPIGGTIHAFRPTLDLTKFFKLARNTSVSFNTNLGAIIPLRHDCANTLDEQVAKNIVLCVPKGQPLSRRRQCAAPGSP